jgi:hypothetical protein
MNFVTRLETFDTEIVLSPGSKWVCAASKPNEVQSQAAVTNEMAASVATSVSQWRPFSFGRRRGEVVGRLRDVPRQLFGNSEKIPAMIPLDHRLNAGNSIH